MSILCVGSPIIIAPILSTGIWPDGRGDGRVFHPLEYIYIYIRWALPTSKAPRIAHVPFMSLSDTFTEMGELEVSCHSFLVVALARRWFPGDAFRWERSHNVLVARFVEKMVSWIRVLVGAKSQRFDGSLWQAAGFRKSCVGGTQVRSVLANSQRARCCC